MCSYLGSYEPTTTTLCSTVLVFLERSSKWGTSLEEVELVRRDLHRVMCLGLREQRLAARVEDGHVLVVLVSGDTLQWGGEG